MSKLTIPSLEKDLNNPQNFNEPPIKYKVGDSLTFQNHAGENVTGKVVVPFTESEFGWLLRVTFGENEIRDIYYNEIIQ